MKICSDCTQSLPFDSFNKKKTNKNNTIQYQSKCKECNKKYHQQHYRNNKNDYLKKARKWDLNYKRTIYQLLMDSSKNGCRYCNEKDFRCIEFNHIDRSTKLYNISHMINNSMSIHDIKMELQKCEPVCANCHKKITAAQFNWYSFLEPPVV